MTTEGKGSVNISGAGSAAGGVYEKVTISGAGKITGDLEAEVVRIAGAAKLAGNVRAREFSAAGSCKVEGNLEGAALKCSGAAKVTGSVKAGELELAGATRIGGGVDAEQFRCKGAFSIGTLLNADRIEIALGGQSTVGEIGGSRITVVRGRTRGGLLDWQWVRQRVLLKTECIEGDDICLEATEARAVRGRRVQIGRGCRIQKVEYAESLEIDPHARVTETAYTGTQPTPPVKHRTVEPPEGWARNHRPKVWRASWNWGKGPGPVSRAILAGVGVLIAILAVGLVLLTVLPAVGLIVAIVLGMVIALVPALLLGVPVLVALALLVRLILLPFELLAWLVGSAWRRLAGR